MPPSNLYVIELQRSDGSWQIATSLSGHDLVYTDLSTLEEDFSVLNRGPEILRIVKYTNGEVL